MSATVTHIADVTVMAPADKAHRRLAQALARVEEDYWAVADAVHEAHVSEAWLRDDRAHEARYRQIMMDQNFTSIFPAYCWDEFGVRAGYLSYVDIAGRLRAAVDNPLGRPNGIDWSRFTLAAVKPVSSAIVDTYEPDDVAAALVAAQRLASIDAAAHPRPGHQGDEDRAPVKPSHVRAALVEAGIAPPRARHLDEMEAAERRSVRLDRAAVRAMDDLAFLISERRRKIATEIIVSAIRRLADHPQSLEAIRAALEAM